MRGNGNVYWGLASLAIILFLFSVTLHTMSVTDLDGIAQQPTMIISEPEITGMSVAGISHGPIDINGDVDFAATALTEGWPGDGSPENPYIIDGLDIDLGGEAGHGISISNTRVNFTISNCHIINANVWLEDPPVQPAGIYLENVMYGKLLENTFDNNYCGISLCDSDYNTVANNTCTSSSRGIYLDDSNSNTVVDNTCTSSAWLGIYLDHSNSNNVSNNTCTSNTLDGIRIQYSNFNTVANNTCTSNGDCGIYLQGSDSNALVNNTCSSNSLHGIYVLGSHSNTVSDNTCTSNTDYGIHLYGADSNTVSDNTCSSNNVGVYCVESFTLGSNDIHWNVFADNTINGWDDATGNVYDYNFWSDYAGTDSNGDGFGDTPYTINGNSDPHPLMFLPTGLIWTEAPVDQTIEIGTHFTYDLNAMAYTPLLWSVNDTAHFTIDDQGVLESIGLLSFGAHGVRVTVTNIYGVSISAKFTVEVLFVIDIDGDAEFAAMAEAQGWLGDGSSDYPYVIEGLEINRSGEEGYCISIENTRVYFIIRDCILTGAKDPNLYPLASGIHLNNVRNGYLIDNICSENWNGISIYHSRSITVADNICNSNNRYGIYILYSEANAVIDNTCNSNSIHGIFLQEFCDGNLLARNTCNENSQSGIQLTSSSQRNIIDENTCNHNGHDGIYINDCQNNILSNNDCSYNSNGHSDERGGISLSSCEGHTVVNNTCNSNSECGIYIISGADHVLYNNTCNSNGLHGIHGFLGFSFWVLDNNTCSYNSQCGLYFHGNVYVEVTAANNTCVNNAKGILLAVDAENFQVVWNLFIDNVINAEDFGQNNVFDLNYWSDYAGIDADDNGIGDTPYYFADNMDSHPRMLPDVTITAPVAVDDAYTTDEDIPLVIDAPGVLENDYDADGDILESHLLT